MKPRIVLYLFAAILAAVTIATSVQSQNEPSPGEPAAPASAPKEELTFWQIIKLGGWCMWPLGACSVATFALVIYNAIAVRPTKLLRPDIVAQLQGAFDSLDIEAARNICVANPGPITNITLAGLGRIRDGEVRIESIEKGMEEASTAEVTGPLVPINYLSVIGVVSPMIGLLGTVSGMISGFHAMALGGMGRPELLANSISEALITTAAGLIIGIPAMIGYFYFKNRYMRVVSASSRICGELVDALNVAVRRYQRGATAAATEEAKA